MLRFNVKSCTKIGKREQIIDFIEKEFLSFSFGIALRKASLH